MKRRLLTSSRPCSHDRPTSSALQSSVRSSDSLRIVVTVLITLIYTGCATHAKYNALLNTWIGRPTDQLILKWGAPTRHYNMSDGTVMLEYFAENCVQNPGYTYTVPQTTTHSGQALALGPNGALQQGLYQGTQTTQVPVTVPPSINCYRCTTRFVQGPDGLLKNWAWEGNGCKAR